MTPRVAQTGLHFGADDLDGTVETEEIFHRAGAVSPQSVARRRLIALIEEAGRVAVERDTLYNPVDPTRDGVQGFAGGEMLDAGGPLSVGVRTGS